VAENNNQTKSFNIKWQKWQDPFDNEDIKEIIDKHKKNQVDDEDESVVEHNHIKVMMHPILGAIPVTDYSQPGKLFNFWIGHTDFTISNAVMKIIEDTDGVEVLDIISRYRFRVGIGALFQDREVFDKIITNIREKSEHKITLINSTIEEVPNFEKKE